MDSQKKGTARLTLPMSGWLAAERSGEQLVAFSKDRQWRVKDLRLDVLHLVNRISATAAPRWALCFDSPYAFVASLLAVLYCGRTPILPGHCRQAVLREMQPEFDALLTDQPLELNCPTLRFPFESQPPLAPEQLTLPTWQDDLSLVLFTSGSTGAPQKVVKPVASLERESQWLAECWQALPTNARLAATVAHHHMYGLTFSLVLPLSLGLPIYASRIEYHEQLIELARGGPLLLIASPAFLQRLDPALPAACCELVFSAGGPLSYEAAQRAQSQCGVLPTEIYGTTETGILAHRQQLAQNSPWELFGGISLLSQDDGGQRALSELIPQPDGVLLSDTITLLEDPRQFHLGDRQDRVVKIAEQRISLTEVELRLRGIEWLSDASVLLLNKRGRDHVAALIVLSSAGQQQLGRLGQAAFQAALHQQLRLWLSPVAIPRLWRIAPEIPVNAQGKRAYAEIQEMFL